MENINESALEVHGKLTSNRVIGTLIIGGVAIIAISASLFIHSNKVMQDEPQKSQSAVSLQPANDDDILKIVQKANKERTKNSLKSSAPEQSNLVSQMDVPPIVSNNQQMNFNRLGTADSAQLSAEAQKKQQQADQKQQAYVSALSSNNGTIKLSAIALPGKNSSSSPTLDNQDIAINKNNTSNPLKTTAAAIQSPDIVDRKSPPSPYFLKAGTNIPLTLTKGLNSDLPGNVTGVVRTNVYDTPTHKILLIPQGSTMFGKYDNHIVFGDTRIAVGWTKLYYPDGSYVNLQAVPGTDLQGFSGFSDKVDNHYWQLFGASFIMGVLTGAIQYSQNNTNSNVQSGGYGFTNPNPTVGQTMAGSLGQQLGQTGLAVTNKFLNVQPTITIRDGSKVNAELQAELVLPPIGGIEP